MEARKEAGDVDLAAFDLECGVGISISPEEIKSFVAKFIEENKEDLETRRYTAVGSLLGKLKGSKDLKWASIVLVKQDFDAAILEALGPRDERDDGKKKVSDSCYLHFS
jgi:glutaminyl-tRNA synthetase